MIGGDGLYAVLMLLILALALHAGVTQEPTASLAGLDVSKRVERRNLSSI